MDPQDQPTPAQPPQVVPQATVPVEQQQVVPPSAPIQPPAQSTNQPPSKPPFWKNISWKIVAGVFAALLVVGGGIAFARAFLFNGEKEPQKVTEIVWWGMQLEASQVAPILAEYEKNTGVHITYIQQAPQDYRDRLSAALGRGEGPDVFEIHNTWPLMFKGDLAKAPSDVFTDEDFKNTFYPVVTRDMLQDGGYVGVPLEYDGLGLYVNTQMFESQNRLVPDTWNELWESAQFFTKRDIDKRITQAGIPLGRTDNVNNWQDVLSLMLLQEGTSPETPTGVDAETAFLSFIRFADEYEGVWDETLPEGREAFARGQVPMYFGKASDVSFIKAIAPDLVFKVVPVPQLPKTVANTADTTWASYWVQSVSQKSDKRDAAWDFVKYLSSREVVNVLANESFAPSRLDLAALFAEDPVFGAYIRQAPYAFTGYLSSGTYDGAKGVNTQIANHYKAAIEGFVNEDNAEDLLATLKAGISDALSQYAGR